MTATNYLNHFKIASRNIGSRLSSKTVAPIRDIILELTTSNPEVDIWMIQEIRLYNQLQLQQLKNTLKSKNIMVIMHHYSDLTAFIVFSPYQELKFDLLELTNEEIINVAHRVSSLSIRLFSGESVLLLNFYLPSGNYNAQKTIMESVSAQLSNLQKKNERYLILGGDYNHVLDPQKDVLVPKDRVLAPIYRPEKDIIEFMTQFIEKFQLQDGFRLKNPTRVEPTNQQGPDMIQRRLDRFYFSLNLNSKFHGYSLLQENRCISTHVTISMLFRINKKSPLTVGPSRFCLSRTLLGDSDFMQYLNRPISSSNRSGFQLWDFQMNYIRQQVGIFKRALRTIRNHSQNEIAPSVSVGAEDHDWTLEKKLKFRLRGPDLQEYIINMVSASGQQLTTTEDMLQEATCFYKQLFSSMPSHRIQYDFISSFEPTLNLLEQNKLEAPFTENELYQQLQQIKKYTATGLDGISYYGLVSLWETLGPSLTMAANYILETGTLPLSMQKVIIRLIKKSPKSAGTIGDFRPISVTTCALRLLSSCFETRLKSSATTLIDAAQTGFIQGRSIDNTINMVGMVMTELTKPSTDIDDYACFVALDFHKAFDSVSHDYLNELLAHINCGHRARNFLMAITTQQTAQVTINNCLGEEFVLNSGTRQGNPVSPFLFILSLETLLSKINQNLEGASFLGHRFRLAYAAYADDVIIFCKNQQDQQRLLQLLETFGQDSGLVINKHKSKIFYYRTPPLEKILPFPAQCLDLESFSYLGIPMKEADENYDPWKKKLRDLLAQIYLAPTSDLSIMVTIKLMNVFIFSQLYYMDLHSPISAAAIKEIYKKIQGCLPFRIAIDRLLTPKHLGGFGLINIASQVKGKRGKQIYHLFTHSHDPLVRAFKFKLQLTINEVLQPFIKQDSSLEGTSIFPWFRFLCDIKPLCPLGKKQFQQRVFSKLSKSALSWLKAWFDITSYHGPYIYETISHMSGQEYESLFEEDFTYILQHVEGVDGKALTEGSFHHLSQKLSSKLPIIPKGWSSNTELQFITSLQWKRFWSRLSDLQTENLGSLQTYHLFVLGYYSHYPFYKPVSSTSSNRSSATFFLGNIAREALSQVENNQEASQNSEDVVTNQSTHIPSCRFCQMDASDHIGHHAFECQDTLSLWPFGQFPQRSYSFVIGNSQNTDEQYFLINKYLGVLLNQVKRRQR
ncbi:polyprotein of L1-like non-LTR retrotransposon [Candida dubliniensis CD36]|uniref:Polyprotein of L1-like non-LTR retrotransposon n=1 Tax=Candida dubliniensis (strain CD36 / ATCC MYA-646 / CBS 7987 / NCPF 3949 / NRRL Y-17841) TaxID=573826 RepID=B9WAU2_CANDC|nr:polyprotein of L1-like non-LTR retrotransposon [Candida dubliniensis CD36]CAX43512.1 polyprotein of L1-like non-LTR retrotransposon [Candida dubliniensis CD36]